MRFPPVALGEELSSGMALSILSECTMTVRLSAASFWPLLWAGALGAAGAGKSKGLIFTLESHAGYLGIIWKSSGMVNSGKWS